MKRVSAWITLLCFATQALAVNFEALDNSEKGKHFVGNHQDAAYTVPKGTRGKVKFITQLPAQNNRSGEFDSYLGIEIDKVGPGVKTGIKPGMTILVYYSSEKSQRVMKLTDDDHKPVKNAADAKYGIATRTFTHLTENRTETKSASPKSKSVPLPEAKPEIPKAPPPTCSVGGLSGSVAKNMHDALNCLSEKLHGRPSVPPTPPKPNDPITGIILTYINNFVWNAIQNESRFNQRHFKTIEARDRAREAEFNRREKINEITAPALVQAARNENLEESLLAGQAQVESGFNTEVCSKAGACGLFQIMLKTAKQYANNPKLTKKDLKDSRLSAAIGAAFLKDLTRQTHGNLRKALQYYNDGAKNMHDIEAGKKQMPKETAEYPTKVLNAAMQIKAAENEALRKLAANQ